MIELEDAEETRKRLGIQGLALLPVLHDSDVPALKTICQYTVAKSARISNMDRVEEACGLPKKIMHNSELQTLFPSLCRIEVYMRKEKQEAETENIFNLKRECRHFSMRTNSAFGNCTCLAITNLFRGIGGEANHLSMQIFARFPPSHWELQRIVLKLCTSGILKSQFVEEKKILNLNYSIDMKVINDKDTFAILPKLLAEEGEVLPPQVFLPKFLSRTISEAAKSYLEQTKASLKKILTEKNYSVPYARECTVCNCCLCRVMKEYSHK